MKAERQDQLLLRSRLASQGVHVEDIYDLEKSPRLLERVAPTLVGLLGDPESHRIKADVVRVVSLASVPPCVFVEELEHLVPVVASEASLSTRRRSQLRQSTL